MDLLSLSRRRSSWRNAHSSEEQGETAVFAGYLKKDKALTLPGHLWRGRLTVQPKDNTRARGGARSCRAARTGKAPVPYFCCFNTHRNFENARSQKSL